MLSKTMTTQHNLLLIEDEDDIRDMLRFSFKKSDYTLFEAKDMYVAKQQLAQRHYALIILDWMLPHCSGIDLLKWLRARTETAHIPVIMLTAKAEESNKILALQQGADDYVTKPFSPKELLARIHAVLRRSDQLHQQTELHYHQLTLNLKSQQVSINDTTIALTPKEYQLLRYFCQHPGEVIDRERLITHIWGYNAHVTDRVVDVHIRRLRNKLKAHDAVWKLSAVRGSGYRLDEP